MIINRYPFISLVGRKDVFQRIVQASEHFVPGIFDFVPKTFIFSQETALFKQYQAKMGKGISYIAKPVKGAKGNSIVLFRELKELSSKWMEDTVVQQYVNEPYLLNGLKFDIRVYVAITGTTEGKMHAFLADEGIVRFCTEDYQKAAPANFKNIQMHITNG